MKKCKGTGKANGYGCGIELPYTTKGTLKIYKATYGLGLDCLCYAKWCIETKEGKEHLQTKVIPTAQKKTEKAEKIKRKQEKESIIPYDQLLNQKFQECARVIDYGQKCLARDVIPETPSGGHLWGKQSNKPLSWNIHNIHLQSFKSNTTTKEDALMWEGLIRVYGFNYKNFIYGFRKFQTLKLSQAEKKEALIRIKNIVKDLRKDGKVYSTSERIELRNRINLEVGIYPKEIAVYDKNQLYE